MQKIKMILAAGVLAAVTIFSIAGLCFSDDAQPTAAAPQGATMSNVSTTPPATPAPASAN